MRVTSDYLSACDQLIRSGRAAQAAKELAALNLKEIPREFRLSVAALSRRVELIPMGLKVLESIVHPKHSVDRFNATHQEIAEYAVLLQRCGAVEEALELLAKVDFSVAPEANLFKAFCHMSRWEPSEAVKCLRIYIEGPLDSYRKLVGRVNLAAALNLCAEFEEAKVISSDCISFARSERFLRLHANALELRAQCHISQREFSEARADLKTAADLIQSNRTRDQLWIQKWQAVVDGLENRRSETLLAFREEALKRCHWETVRDADFYLLEIEFDRERFEKLYFGTPFENFRTNLALTFHQRSLPGKILVGKSEKGFLDLETGSIECSNGALAIENSNFRLIEVLFRDFYRPIKMGALFSALFPGEHFSIFSSPARVHQTIYRCRSWLEENEIPLSITQDSGHYVIRARNDFGVWVPRERRAPNENEIRLKTLQIKFAGNEFFAAADAKSALGLSSTSFSRFTSWAISGGVLERLGGGRSTFYRLVSRAPDQSQKAA